MKAKESKDLVVSALLLALAFGIAFSGGFRAIFDPDRLISVFLLALVGVSTGFVLHELGHRFVARRFGCFAEYKMWFTGLILAIVCSLFGFVFAAPGAVMVHPGADLWGRPTLTKQRLGLISIAGPSMNICLAVVFILLNTLYPSLVFSLGARINTWLALFNLLPFGLLDGAKIFSWDKKVWLAAVIITVGLFGIGFLIL
ncbi:MAG: site-2 protease family protein [Dehalococcoidales bacterium]|nr:site-2 protease family protein [Dehalococcoidales bacterium]